jgi:SSS family transporter
MSLGIGWFIGLFIVYLIANAVLVIYQGKKVKGIGDFALGGKTIGPVVLAFSFFATRLSGSTYIGEPGFTYAFGWPYSWIGVFNAAFWLAAILVVARRMRLYSGALGTLTVPDFIGQRYESDFLRIWTSIGVTVFYIFVMVAQYKAIIAVFVTLLGIPQWLTIVLFSVITLFYVNVGGFRSVVYTDFLQGVLMVSIAVVLFFVTFKEMGFSFAFVNNELAKMDPELVRPYQDEGLFALSGVICLPFYLFISLVSNPYCTVRLMALSDVGKTTFKKFGITVLSCGMICMLMYCVGIFGRVLFPDLADPDTVVPTVASVMFPQWFLALFAIAMFAAIISSVDSMLQTASSMMSVDIYQKTINRKASSEKVARVARISSVAVILIVLIIAFVQLPQFLSLLSLMATAGSGLVTLCPMIIGLYWEKASRAGAIASSVGAIALFAFFSFVVRINTWERGVLCAVLSVIIMIVVSKLTKPVDQSVLDRMKGKEFKE